MNDRYFQERGYTSEALDCYQIAQKNADSIIAIHQEQGSPAVPNPDHERAKALLAETHNNVAGSATEFNDADTAIHHFQIYNNMLRDEHDKAPHVADSRLTSSFFNLGLSYAMKADYDQAISHCNQALAEAERLFDPRKIKFARSLALINLGLTNWLMSRQEDALKFLTTALSEREELLGPNDRQSMM